MLDFFIDNVTTHGPGFAYLLLFLGSFVENVFPPFPGDLTTLSGGLLVGRGRLLLFPVYVSTMSGSLSGFMLVYYLGLTKGRWLFTKRTFAFLGPEKLAKVEGWFAKYGGAVILFNRFLSGIRSVVAVSAGIAGMSPGEVAVYALISICIWNGLLIYAGSVFGSNWETVVSLLRTYGHVVLVAVGMGVVVFLIRFYWKRRSLESMEKGD